MCILFICWEVLKGRGRGRVHTQQTLRGHISFPTAAYCPHWAFASQFDIQCASPQKSGAYPQKPESLQHAPFTQGLPGAQVPSPEVPSAACLVMNKFLERSPAGLSIVPLKVGVELEGCSKSALYTVWFSRGCGKVVTVVEFELAVPLRS